MQILYNLLSNAARFSEPGGEIRLSVTGRTGRIQFIVEDDGADLWQDLRQRVGGGLAWTSIFLALEPARLQAFAAAFPDANPYLFANMDMSCGIGACRSCHVTVSDNKDGEASCRVGPWFALKRVNLVRLQFASAPFI